MFISTLLKVGFHAVKYSITEARKNRDAWYAAIREGNIEAVKAFIEAGVDVNKKDEYKQSPLYLAAEGRGADHTEIVRILLNAGACYLGGWYGSGSKVHCHPLCRAADVGNIETVKLLLLERCSVINTCDCLERTALHYAADSGNTEIVKMLIAKKANVHIADKFGNTPLHEAASSNFDNPEIVKILIAAGADVNRANNDGKTPLFLAGEKSNTEIVSILRAEGARY